MSDMTQPATLSFLGATATVTGSRYLVRCGGRSLLVDCGLFQGYKPLRLRNWAPFPVDPASIDAVILTHAHLDHSGYLPRLVRNGFKGRIWCSAATADLCRILWPDSASLLEEEAEHANRHKSSRHHPALPLYDQHDAAQALKLLHDVEFDHSFEPVPGLRAHLRCQGHILGAAAVALDTPGGRVLFSGDIGRPNDPVMPAPAAIEDCDWIVTESTYGNRRHAPEALEDELEAAVQPVLARGGVAIIPAFAVGRAQLLLYLLVRLQQSGRLPHVPVYLNSPMASDVTDLYQRHAGLHRLGAPELRAMAEAVTVINSVEESKALNTRHGPMVIVSASGMLTGGRVLHHLIAFGGDSRNAIILAGFQAGGTRGAALQGGDRSLRIYGQDVDIRASVTTLDAASAHADADEILDWLRTSPRPPRRVFITHGEAEAAERLRVRIKRELGWEAHTPDYLEQVELDFADD